MAWRQVYKLQAIFLRHFGKCASATWNIHVGLLHIGVNKNSRDHVENSWKSQLRIWQILGFMWSWPSYWSLLPVVRQHWDWIIPIYRKYANGQMSYQQVSHAKQKLLTRPDLLVLSSLHKLCSRSTSSVLCLVFSQDCEFFLCDIGIVLATAPKRSSRWYLPLWAFTVEMLALGYVQTSILLYTVLLPGVLVIQSNIICVLKGYLKTTIAKYHRGDHSRRLNRIQHEWAIGEYGFVTALKTQNR